MSDTVMCLFDFSTILITRLKYFSRREHIHEVRVFWQIFPRNLRTFKISSPYSRSGYAPIINQGSSFRK